MNGGGRESTRDAIATTKTNNAEDCYGNLGKASRFFAVVLFMITGADLKINITTIVEFNKNSENRCERKFICIVLPPLGASVIQLSNRRRCFMNLKVKAVGYFGRRINGSVQ